MIKNAKSDIKRIKFPKPKNVMKASCFTFFTATAIAMVISFYDYGISKLVNLVINLF